MGPDFPRGWTLSSVANTAGTVSLTIPACPGITHVITDIDARVVDINAAPGSYGSDVNVLKAGVTLIWTGFVYIAAIPGTDEVTFSGSLSGDTSGALEVEFTTAMVANIQQSLSVQGYSF